MSERSFQRLFSKEVGTSPGKFVERCRIDAGRRLLESTSEGLSAIARRCGFTSPETFLRSFKRLVGVSPTEYRQRFSARRVPGPERRARSESDSLPLHGEVGVNRQ